MAMRYALIVALIVAGAGLALPGAARAQAAAESAVILSGTGQSTGNAARSMGQSVAGGIGRASDAVAATNAGARAGRRPRGGNGGVSIGYAVSGGSGDVLEGTDAPSVQTGSGAAIRVSGRLIPAAAAPACEKDCPAPAASPPPKP